MQYWSQFKYQKLNVHLREPHKPKSTRSKITNLNMHTHSTLTIVNALHQQFTRTNVIRKFVILCVSHYEYLFSTSTSVITEYHSRFLIIVELLEHAEFQIKHWVSP